MPEAAVDEHILERRLKVSWVRLAAITMSFRISPFNHRLNEIEPLAPDDCGLHAGGELERLDERAWA